MKNIINVGDVITCIKNGGNNTSIKGDWKTASSGDGPFKIIAIHKGGVYSGCGMSTLETECGKFLWNDTENYKIIKNSEPIYEIY